MSRVRWGALWLGLAAVLAIASMIAASVSRSDFVGGEALPFTHRLLDDDGPGDPWGKAVGDVDGDGRPDVVVGGHASRPPAWWRRLLNLVRLYDSAWSDHGDLVWYSGATGQKRLISNRFNIRTDMEVADVDGDGRSDVVAVTDQGLVWFRNPDWVPFIIDRRALHDVEVADLDGDGKPDIVARGQHLFGPGGSDLLHFFQQVSPTAWEHREVTMRQEAQRANVGEGLKVADLDGDGRPDVVVNQLWLRNPGQFQNMGTWRTERYCTGWRWPHAYVEVADINGDGHPDIVMAPAEPAGMSYRLSWCEAPTRAGGAWTEHVIDARVETTMHGVAVGDFDGDGRLDVAISMLHSSKGAKSVALYVQGETRGVWQRHVIDGRGSHSLKALDFNQDGALDLFGANFGGPDQGVRLWLNATPRRTAHGWRRHVIDNEKPWRSVFVYAVDLDGDGHRDLITGGWWYRNPGSISRRWQRHEIGPGANNVAAVFDIDADGRADVLFSTWRDGHEWTFMERLRRKLSGGSVDPGGGFVWARNLGQGRFEVHRNVPTGAGDFLQGVSVATLEGERSVLLSWHRAGVGLQRLRVPARPSATPWTIDKFAEVSQDEAISAVDLDGDGRLDVLMGTKWLRSLGGGRYDEHEIVHPAGSPDRHRAADINGDGRPDIVVGYQSISRPGKLAWYRSGPDPRQPWIEHVIAHPVGPMSLDVADVDGDGDLDVVIGEHNLRNPAAARLIWYENVGGNGTRWVPHVIHTGDEHHDGALVVDLNGDGLLDIVSIGWGHDRLVVYENLPFRSVTSAPKRSRPP